MYALKIGFESSQIAWFMAAAIVGSTLLQWPVGMLSDRMDRRRVVVGLSAAVSVIALVLAMLPGHAALPIFALMFLYGGLSFPLYGVFLSLAADRMRGDELVAASSKVLLVNGAGSAIGPVLVAWLMEAVDARAYLVFVAAIHVLVCHWRHTACCGAVAAWRRSAHHVNAAPQGSVVAAEMAGAWPAEP